MKSRIGSVVRAAMIAATLSAIPTASAALQYVNAEQAAAGDSSFTLDFLGADFGDGFGSVRTSQISTTLLGLAVDEVLESAKINYYNQSVDALTLPYGVNTGPLTIKVVPGTQTSVSYEEIAPGVFSFQTAEFYEIKFTADLSGFGIPGTSVFLPGGASGIIDYTNETVSMAWTGAGQLLNPVTGGVIVFQYSCDVTTSFSEPPEAGTIGITPPVLTGPRPAR